LSTRLVFDEFSVLDTIDVLIVLFIIWISSLMDLLWPLILLNFKLGL